MATAGPPGISPWFARRAAERLASGDTSDAVRLCTEGIAEYPWYATGAYILGQCYEHLGRIAEAIMEYRRASVLAPDSRVVRDALARAEQRDRHAFEAYAIQQINALNRPSGSVGFDDYVAGEGGAAEGSADFLRKQADAARHEDARAGAGKETAGVPSPSPRIVTVTLAEIYAAQGEYREAVEAYRILLQRRPEESEGYHRRIQELEVLAAAAEKPLE